MVPTLTLYRMDGSCAMIPHALLREVGVEFKEVRLPRLSNPKDTGDMTVEEYKMNINPIGYVPSLAIDGQVITENPAIATYISGLAPERKLLGRDAVEAARAHSWMCWLSGTLHGYGFGALWRPARFVDQPELYDAVKAKGLSTIKASYEKIEKGISDAWALGDHQTAVDVALHTFYRWGRDIGIDMEKAYPRYSSLMRRAEQVEGLKKAMEIENRPLLFSKI